MDKIAWHEHCVLRDDVRQGTLDLTKFAAHLYGVRTGEAPNVYRMPDQFFSRTYPTYNLKTLVRDVFHRLSGQGGKPVIRVQVTYGGGKTHALIALLHLAERGSELKTHRTVKEFMEFSRVDPLPQTRVALLPFDQFDVKTGLLVYSPDGKQRRVNTPWGALAYQLAGDEGLAKVAAHEADYITPAEPLLADLLKAPQAEGLSTLILIDETLLYVRGAVNDDPKRLGILQDFFQMLTQAVSAVDRAAMVASLITSDVVSNDPTGVEVLRTLEHVFNRVAEGAEPVVRADVSELLRRRLFEDVPPEETRRAVVDSLTGAMQKLPLRDSQKDQTAYDRLLESYPFHPDLLDVFYQKWTQLDNFQRTRGMLRMFAIALRASDGQDSSAFVGPSALLGTDGEPSEAVGELIGVCEEGNQWTSILTGELQKAREVQGNFPMLKGREIEGAVLSTFLHSQPPGQKADLRDLYPLLAHPDIDKISVEEGLAKWREISWFLKEDRDIWALGTTPNLTSMHTRAMGRLTDDRINDDLVKRLRYAKLGQNADDVAVHLLPNSPADIPDNPDLHFVIVGPEYTAVPGDGVSAPLEAFFERTYRNNVIILAPDNARLAGLRHRIRKILGWEGIESGDEIDLLTEPQKALLLQRKRDDEAGITDSIKSTYSVLIEVDEAGEIKARLLPPGPESPFERVKTFLVEAERLLTTSLDPYLLTPDSFFELWGEEETSKPIQGLYRMFASLPRLPRLLGRKVFVETLQRGVREGRIVLRSVRPDGSQHTYWRESPPDEDLSNRDLEIVPIEHAELHNLSPDLLRPEGLPELWQDGSASITVGAIREFFAGEDVPKLASDEILFGAIRAAVEVRSLMARRQDRAYLGEAIPDAEFSNDLELCHPLAGISGSEISQNSLPEAWEDGTSSVSKVMDALATRKGSPIPWRFVVDAVDDGLSNNLFKITEGSPAWPCSADDADKIGLQVSQVPVTINPTDFMEMIQQPFDEFGQPTLGLIKEKLESKKGVSISDDAFHNAVQKAIDDKIITLVDPLTDDLYKVRVKQPSWMRHTESHLTETEIQDLSGTIGNLIEIAPELDFKFRIAITAEGEPPSDEVLEQINEVLRKVTDQLKFD
jgi:hypothetical protein